MEIPWGTKAIADVVENGDISSKDAEYESDSVDDDSVTSSYGSTVTLSDDGSVTSSYGSENEPEADGQSKTLHFKTEKNQNFERFY